MTVKSKPLNPSDYGISPEYGFLSPQAPATTFTNPYYQPWDDMIAHLPHLIKTATLKSQISNLPLLRTENLDDDDLQLRRAYVVLAFTIHAYVWHQSPPNASVPAQLAEPFLQICERLRMQPVVSYAGLCTWNWRLLDADGDFDLRNLETIASFTGTRGEAAFYHVPVLVEREGGALMHVLLDAVAAAQEEGRTEVVVEALRATTQSVLRMGAHLPKLYANLDAEFFYHVHRPFMAGGKGMEEKGLPRGMVLEREDGEKVPLKLVGGSAVQSSLFPFLDHVLGVVHEDGALFKEMREYMPGAHRDFLREVEKLPSLRQYVEATSDSELKAAYDECLQQLRSWRGKHIAVVSKYIVQPAREAQRAARVDRIEVNGAAETDQEWELQGTGGSALIPFLRQARDDTVGIGV